MMKLIVDDFKKNLYLLNKSIIKLNIIFYIRKKEGISKWLNS